MICFTLSGHMYDLVSFLSLAVVVLADGDYKGRYTRDVQNYQVVVPKKVSANGEFVSYYLPHFYNAARVKRGVDTGQVHYVVQIDGEDRVLELLPTEDFHAPGFVIEHHEKDARNNISTVRLRRPKNPSCYYHGGIKNVPNSATAITACSGLAGSIQIGTTQYMIEPVEDEGKPTVDVKHKHLLYKRSNQRVINNTTSCGTTGSSKEAFKKRMEWEDKYGRQVEASMKGVEPSYLINKNGKLSVEKNLERERRWCTTCKPKLRLHCQTPPVPCQVERPLFVELLMVVGPRVAATKFLDDDTEQYVNTIINIVVKHFRDNSLGRPIQIKLVRVITLEYLYADLDAKRYNPTVLLERFCDWQMHFNPKKEEHPNHHDFAIYLVKFEQCQGSLLGLTNMASMCRPDKSCAIVSQEGLLTGHVITHMLGHSLGADHDEMGLSGCCAEEPDGTCYHMGPNICSWSSAWSMCSKQCISRFTQTHASWCMDDIPTAVDLTDPILLPGQVYSAAEQCRINFEIDSYACLVGEFCKRLFCKINDNECVSTGDPPALGTRCGPDQWCFNGRCVHRGTRPGATNGEWGMWSHWTPCTKTCGGGIQSAHRACDSPAPSQGGRPCPGSWIKSRMCNVGGCEDAGKGFLDQQCKATNVKQFHGRKHEWLFFNQQIEDLKCVVICINERNQVAVRSPLAIDGTFCQPGAKDVCIRGACTPVGCDWVIGSKAKEDACGICHGNGTECKIIQGFFTDTNFQGVIQFLKLPIGTSMVMIRETRPSPCYFVISNSLNSTYYLNNDNSDEVQFKIGGFTIQGTFGIYQLKANMERIFIKDPLKVPITISMVCRDRERSIGILYQYALPLGNPPSSSPSYTWEYLSWNKCPLPCGGAVQRSAAVCVEAQGGEVEDNYCSLETRPPDKIRVCNPKACKARWWVGPWAECECFNREGITTRLVMCAHIKEARSSYVVIVDEEECLGDSKPTSQKPCDPEKNKELWLKKEQVKRDLADIIPYSEAADDYTIWDEVPEDKYPFMANIRKLIDSLDPESANDYAYLRRTGMDNVVWEKLRDDNQMDVRLRRRRTIVSSTESGSTNGIQIDGRTSVLKRQKKSPAGKVESTTTVAATSTKKQTGTTKIGEPRATTGNTGKTTAKLQGDISALTRRLHSTATPHHALMTLSQIGNKFRNIVPPVARSKEVTASFYGPNIPKNMKELATVPRRIEITTQPTLKFTDSNTDIAAIGVKTTNLVEKVQDPKKVKPLVPATQAGVAFTKPLHNTEMSIPEANPGDPGLTAYSIYASETPVPQKKCWQMEMKMPKEIPTCKPRGEEVPEPAEAPPEMDYVNMSNIKIYLVPIQTTIRTIIQDDQEFVMMETMAKYPVADEMKIIEHRGAAARNQLKFARARQEARTDKLNMQD